MDLLIDSNLANNSCFQNVWWCIIIITGHDFVKIIFVRISWIVKMNIYQSHKYRFLSCPAAMIPCSAISIIVLMPASNWRLWIELFPFQSQNFIVPSFAQLTITSFVYWIIFVMCEICSFGRFRIKFPVVMSHILIILSKPPLNNVVLSCSKQIVQMKSKCPVNVFKQAELYFFVKLHTFIVLSELPDIKVCPVDVHSRQSTSLMCPLKFLIFSPLSKSQTLIV